MIGQLSLTALAALGAVNASPLNKRQASSAVSSAVESASSAIESATSAVASATGAASTAASSAVGSATGSSAATATSTSTSTGTASAGNESYPLFPCPSGYLLTYVTQNATVPIPITQVTPALGEWASSPIFPNVTMPMGGNEPGATHTLNIAGLAINEVLVNATSNSTSGYVSWTWNLTNPEPLMAPGVSISNWTATLNVYDPDFTTTQMIGNTTVADAFVNFCASDQAAGSQLLNSVLGLYLGNAAMALQGNMTAPMSSMAPGAMTTAAGAMSTAMSSAMSATSAAASGASSAASGASSAVQSAASAASSAVSSATSAAAGAASTTA